MWSRAVTAADWFTLAFTVTLAAATIDTTSYAFAPALVIFPLALAWIACAVAWVVSLHVQPDAASNPIGAALLVLTLVVLPLGILFVPIAGEPAIGLVTALLVAHLLLALRRRRRIVWLVPPIVVVVTLAIALSGVPRIVRLQLSEPDLTTFAQELEGRQVEPPTMDSAPAQVGWTTIYEVLETGGRSHLVTTYVGVPGDVPAGLVHSPDESPRGQTYQHVYGPWYRWLPSGYSFD